MAPKPAERTAVHREKKNTARVKQSTKQQLGTKQHAVSSLSRPCRQLFCLRTNVFLDSARTVHTPRAQPAVLGRESPQPARSRMRNRISRQRPPADREHSGTRQTTGHTSSPHT